MLNLKPLQFLETASAAIRPRRRLRIPDELTDDDEDYDEPIYASPSLDETSPLPSVQSPQSVDTAKQKQLLGPLADHRPPTQTASPIDLELNSNIIDHNSHSPKEISTGNINTKDNQAGLASTPTAPTKKSTTISRSAPVTRIGSRSGQVTAPNCTNSPTSNHNNFKRTNTCHDSETENSSPKSMSRGTESNAVTPCSNDTSPGSKKTATKHPTASQVLSPGSTAQGIVSTPSASTPASISTSATTKPKPKRRKRQTALDHLTVNSQTIAEGYVRLTVDVWKNKQEALKRAQKERKRLEEALQQSQEDCTKLQEEVEEARSQKKVAVRNLKRLSTQLVKCKVAEEAKEKERKDALKQMKLVQKDLEIATVSAESNDISGKKRKKEKAKKGSNTSNLKKRKNKKQKGQRGGMHGWDSEEEEAKDAYSNVSSNDEDSEADEYSSDEDPDWEGCPVSKRVRKTDPSSSNQDFEEPMKRSSRQRAQAPVEWACAHCTFLNPMSEIDCGACDRRKC